MIALQKLKWYSRFFCYSSTVRRINTQNRDKISVTEWRRRMLNVWSIYYAVYYGVIWPYGGNQIFYQTWKVFNLQWEPIVIRIVLNSSFLFLYELWRNIMIDIIRKFWLKCCCQSKTFRNVFGLGRYSKNAHYISTVNN